MPQQPPFVFLSYAHADEEFATRLKTDLGEQSITAWIDKEGIEVGTREWEETIRNAIRDACVVLIVASPAAQRSPYVKAELRLADMYQRPLYPIWAAGAQWMDSVPLFNLSGTQYIDARETRYKTAFHDLVEVLRKVLSEVPSPPSTSIDLEFEPRNPYKGLRAFGTKDARDFFGREALTSELVETLQEALTPARLQEKASGFLAVVGPSGSGKSSLVMAGLLPRLQRGALTGSESWVYLKPITPGAHPLETLMLMLSDALPEQSMKALRDDLADEEARGLYWYASKLAPSPEVRVVLIVDQFEELFTQTTDEKERKHFIDLLMTAATEPHSPIVVIVTLRADFSDRPMQYPDLYRLIDAHHCSVLGMDYHDLHDVITQPAAQPDVQITFEGDLVGDLLFDTYGQIGALPLLEFTLEQLFRQRRGHLLTLQTYREMGGVKGALTKHAEETYAALPSDEHRRLARALFVRLIDPGATDQDTTRRRATFSEFILDDPIQTRMLHETINAFVEARLLTTNEIAGTMTLEVSHEALIREWKLLSSWIQEARKDIFLQQTISDDVLEWEKLGRPGDRLYRGSQLKEAQTWAKRNLPSRSELTFLHASATRSIQNGVSIAVVLLLLLGTTGLTGWFLLHQPPDPTHVINLNDDGPGSLRWAIANVSDGSTITIDQSLNGKTILLKGGDLNITKSLRINGPNRGTLVVSSGKSGYVIFVHSKVVVTITNLTFANSSYNSGFITNEGKLILSHCIISGNYGGNGSLYNNHGTLILTASTVSGNGAANGGGIDNSGGTVTLTASTVSGNSASNGGGINNIGGTLTLINSTVYGNATNLEYGGGINNIAGKVILAGSTVSNNMSEHAGGGIANRDGQVLVINSTISDNDNENKIDSNILPNYGGGIANFGGQISLINSTISNNISNIGGGISVSGGQVNITFCTIFGNTASSSGGGIFIGDPLNPQKGGRLIIRNSIVANNHANTGLDISGPIISYGYNLIQNLSGTSFIAPLDMHATDISGFTLADLKIDPTLRNNGGSTQTHALLVGSPAIGKIPPGACFVDNIVTDQREVKRPRGSACDIGAYEYTLN